MSAVASRLSEVDTVLDIAVHTLVAGIEIPDLLARPREPHEGQ
jgi:hypothetical protein